MTGATTTDTTRRRWIAGPWLPWWLALSLFPLFLWVVGQRPNVLGLGLAFGFDGLLLLLWWWEVRRLERRMPEISRRPIGRLVVGASADITLQVRSRPQAVAGNRGVVTLTVRDDLPPELDADPTELKTQLQPLGRQILCYQAVPLRRGTVSFGDLHLRLDGRWGLGSLLVTVPAAVNARVYPNVLGPQRYELAAKLGDLRQLGFRNVRRRGRGGDFEQLRDYVQGDPFRDLDWKATAKRQQPITRVFQDERSQPVLVVVDAGRMMAPALDTLSKLDHAVNAALLLAFVALRHGDRVGVLVLDAEVRAFLPPAAGATQYRKILETLSGVEPAQHYADFRALFTFLQLRVPRRSFLVLFTDLVDRTQSQALAEHARLLRRKHVPVCVTLRDPVTTTILASTPESLEDTYHKAAAVDFWQEGERIKRHLKQDAVDIIETNAAQLSAASVNRYLQMKARQQL